MAVSQHRLSELVQPLATSKPARGNDHGEIARCECFRLLHEQLIDGGSAGAEAAVIQLIRWISYYHVKLHIASKYFG